MNNWDFSSWFGSTVVKFAISGAMGGIVRWMTLREGWRDGMVSVIVGAITSVYVGPAARPILRPIVDLTGVEPEAAASLSGFLIGVGGILVSGFFIDAWRLRRKMVAQPEDKEAQP